MHFTKPAFLLLLVFLLGNAGFVMAQTDTIPPQIVNPDLDTINYCSDSVQVVPNISIQNIKMDDALDGMKISIANYKRNEDMLVWNEVHGFVYKWNNYYGHVEIQGAGTEKQYEEAIANIYYKNIIEKPTVGVRSFSISLLDADYLPKTQHFYQYIKELDITWKEAKAAADTMKYYGLQGYLVTIISSLENDFIWTKTDGVGWIGASDEAKEGVWKWVTGPEAGTVFWNGDENGSTVPGKYSNWNSGEPNDTGGDEDFAHINADPNTRAKSWNDLPNGANPNNDSYRAKGYIVEFGGTTGDPEVKLSASAVIQVSKIAFSDEREFEICEGESQQLNLAADTSYSYSWTPDNTTIDNPNISNPIVYPVETTKYTAIGKLDFCTDTADFLVHVNPAPISSLNPEEVYCKGDSITLDPGEHSAYLWSNGDTTRTITVADEKKYWVELSSDIPCSVVDTVEVQWSIRPELDYSSIDTLVCGDTTQTLTLSFEGVSASTKLIPLNSRAKVINENSLNPTITVTEFDKYLFEMQIIDEHGCQFLDTLNIEFHNQPEAIIDMNEDKCKGYSLELSFGGVTIEEALFTWFYNDSVFKSDLGLETVEIPLGYGELNRTVGLKVNEQGCVDSSAQNVTVTPNVEIVANNNEGCTPLLVAFEAKATEDIDAYSWDFGDGNNSINPIISHEYVNLSTADVSYDIALTVTSTEGCTNTGVIDSLVVVHPIPTVDLSFDEDDCNPLQMEIWYEGSANDLDSFYWDLSAFAADEIVRNPANTKGPLEINRSSQPSAKIRIHVVSEFACISESIEKNWKRKPVFEVKVDTIEGCPPLYVSATTRLLDSVDNVSFVYDLGDGTTEAGNDVEHIYTTPNSNNLIQFVGTSSLTGCVETVVYEDTVFVYPVPNAQFTPNPEAVIVSDPEIVFENNTSGAEYYEWDFGDMSAISTEHSPAHRYSDMGFYEVSLFAYNNLGCLDSTTNRVAVTFDKLFPPNAFSPNASDAKDRVFRIHSEGVADEGYQLLIFNRWGEVVFQSNSQTVGWDGKMKNDNLAPSGVYTWVLQYSDFRGELHKQQGLVTLVI